MALFCNLFIERPSYKNQHQNSVDRVNVLDGSMNGKSINYSDTTNNINNNNNVMMMMMMMAK